MRRLALAVVQPGFTGLTAPDWLLRRLDEGLGGVALFARNIASPDQLAALTSAIHEANPAALVAVDEEGGDVTRLEYRTGSSWPGNLALGTVDDVDLTRSVAGEIGTALADVGIDLDYAPDADVNVEASNPVIGVRSFGSDAALVARHTAAWVQGLQSAGVLACAKHFPGHGGTRVDSHLGLPEVDLGDDPTTSPALDPFRAAVAAGTAAVMSGHLRVTGLDPRPATLVPAVMTGLLRDHLGFTGLAVSDGLEMGAVADTAGLASGAVQAVAAGVDALCIGGGLAGADTLDLVVAALIDGVHDGRLGEERLAEAAARVTTASVLRNSLRENATRASAGAPAGLAAAARGLAVRGTPGVRPERPVVAELVAAGNIAVGDETASGLAAAVRRRWPDTPLCHLTEGADLDAALAAAVDRPMWVVVRDPHRHRWMAELVAAIVRRRPDVVVIDTGWPGWSPPEPAVHVITHGASRASGEAVVRLLAP
ncbi:glycoside hydrolase family 3 protein [Pedococcus bigeumensis]|uniref:Glycoside hydrolase family 3 protein n=1 Tax=Pedococcus bigeumensis TaxID=433644 RepID=A0A502CWT2_9MICO|nr:glycoside hydrolase family 3 protein [Pedococcus bigeumensis]